MEAKKSNPYTTVCVDFKGCPVRPSIKEVEKLLKQEMKLDFKQCAAIQMHHVRNCTLISFLEYRSKEIAEEFVKRNNLKHVILHEHVKYKIPVNIDDGAIDVRVCDLPIHLDQTDVRHQMEAYGEVVSVRYEKWKSYFGGTHSGVRIARMHLQRPIPSYAKFDFKTDNGFESFVSRVAYPGQIATCQYCGKEVHFNISCIEAAKRNPTPTPTKKQTQPTQINEKQMLISTIQPNSGTQPRTKNTTPAAPIITETAEAGKLTPEAESQGEEIQPPADQFNIVQYNRGKKAKNQTTSLENIGEAGSSEEDITERNDEIPEDVGAEVASPPRKKMVTRSNKRQE